MASGGGKKKKGEMVFKASGDPLGWSVDNLKRLTRVDDSDILYASFVSEVSECPPPHNTSFIFTCSAYRINQIGD